MPMMKIGFIPSLQFLNPQNCGMIPRHNSWTKHGSLVTFKTTTYQLVIFRNIWKTPTCTMNGNETFTRSYKWQEILPLSGGKTRMIGIEQECIKLIKIGRIIQCPIHGCYIIEIDRIPSQSLGKHRVIFIGIMMFWFVPEKKNPYRRRRCCCLRKDHTKNPSPPKQSKPNFREKEHSDYDCLAGDL